MKIKVIALIVTFAMVIGNCGVLATQNEAEINNEIKQVALTELESLGIIRGYDDGTYRLQNEVTRAEFAAIIARSLGIDGIYNMDGDAVFIDVPQEHWAKDVVNVMAEFGLINGYGDGRYGPDDMVTYEQAIKVIVVALGYDYPAEEKGGYPFGYITVAVDIGVTKNTSGAMGDFAKRKTIFELVYNALHINMMVKKFKGDNIVYEIEQGKTLFNERAKQMDLERGSGLVTANSYTGLNDGKSVGKNFVKIDNEIYNIGVTNAESFLGYQVIFYVEDNEGIRKLHKIVKKDRGFEETEIQASNIERVSGNTLQYWTDDNQSATEQVVYNDETAVIYNGKKLSNSAQSSDFEIKSGSLVFLDNNNNGTSDVVFIKEYGTYIVRSVDVQKQIINLFDYSTKTETRFMSKNHIDLLDSSLKATIYNANGDIIALEDINSWDSLAVYASKDGQLMKIVVSSEKIEGMVEQIDSSAGYITINGTDFGIQKNKNGELVLERSQPGDSGVFFLDIDGRVFYSAVHDEVGGIEDAYVTNNGNTFAYLIDAGTDSGLSSTVRVKLLIKVNSNQQKVITLNLKENIDYNGVRMRSTEALQRLRTNNAGVLSQALRVGTGTDGAISNINTLELHNPKTLRKYISSNKSFDNLVFLESDLTTVFYVDILNGHFYERENLSFSNGRYYDVELYKLSAENASEIDENIILVRAIMNQRIPKDPDKSAISIVSQITQIIDEDGNRRYNVTLVKNDQTITLMSAVYEKIEQDVQMLRIGDLIYYGEDSNGELETVEKVTSLPMQAYFRKGISGPYEQTYGRVVSMAKNQNGTSAVVEIDYNGSKNVSYEIGTKPITIYEKGANRITKGSVDDIRDSQRNNGNGDVVFVAVSNFVVKQVFIIR